MKRIALPLLASALFFGSVSGCTHYTKGLARAGITEEQFVINNASLVFARMQKKYPKLDDAVAHAEGVLIIPHLVKGGLIIGAESGIGVMLHKKPDGKFSPPAFFNIASTSGGLQVGYEEASVVIVFKKGQTMLRSFEHGMTIGGDASVAMGKRNANDTAFAHKDVIEFVESDGAFAGASIGGSLIAARERMTRAYYGPNASAHGVLLDCKFDNQGTAEIRTLLDEYTFPKVASAK